ncbi:MAG: Ig-like domain-containing protein [Lachnospiraceae bacterium]|nr:Ig-like domain-containing protein [Lachnospiraceae bacterium]
MYQKKSQSFFRFLLLLLLTAAALLFLPEVSRESHAAHAKVRLNKDSADMVPGYTLKLKVKGTRKPVTWRSRNRRVAVVDENGLVTAKRAGTCRIIARTGRKKLVCKIRVLNPGSTINTEGAMKGIDVSAWQGSINFKKVKRDGISFVIIRAGHGQSVDSRFAQNYRNARKAGLKVGCYWFVTATTQAQVVSEAQKCIRTISGKRFDMPVFVDIESNSQFRLGKAFCSALVASFCGKLKNAGFDDYGWYTSRSFVPKYLTPAISQKKAYCAWIAEHGPRLNYSDYYDIWQYSHTGRVKGIKTYVDLNWYFPNARE